MKKIRIISTGGTFNKVYEPLSGVLSVDADSKALETIAQKWGCSLEVLNIIGKDSLEMNDADRLELSTRISQSNSTYILIVHGTDTMDVTAEYLAKADLQKCIVLTGAMVPYSIDATEATANLCLAYGFLHALERKGVHIAMNGVVDTYEKVKKDRHLGRFVLC